MKPYNPLEKENLGKSVADSLIKQKPVSLGSIDRFSGAGVYAIYYTGNFDAYSKLRDWNTSIEDLNVPIYVGKAVPTGGRKGNVDPEVSGKGTALFSRLDEHRKSIERLVRRQLFQPRPVQIHEEQIEVPTARLLVVR